MRSVFPERQFVPKFLGPWTKEGVRSGTGIHVTLIYVYSGQGFTTLYREDVYPFDSLVGLQCPSPSEDVCPSSSWVGPTFADGKELHGGRHGCSEVVETEGVRIRKSPVPSGSLAARVGSGPTTRSGRGKRGVGDCLRWTYKQDLGPTFEVVRVDCCPWESLREDPRMTRS